MVSKSDANVPTEQEEFVVDADFHMNVGAEELLPYIDDPKLERKLEFSMPWTRGTNGWISSYAHHNTDGRHAHGDAVGRDEIAEIKKSLGINAVIVSPGMLGLPIARYPILKNVVARAYNDYIIDHVVDPQQGIYGLLIAPQWDPEVGAEEVSRIGDEPGIVGAQGWYTPHKPFGAPEFDVLFDELQRSGLPLALHGSGFSSRYDIQSDTYRTRAESTLSWSHNAMVNVVNMVLTGVFEKYQDLEVVMQESGVSWVPFVASHMDEKYQTYPEDIGITERMYEQGRDYLDGLPSTYLFDHFRFTTQPISLPSQRPDAMFDMCRAESTFIFSSDWPHHTVDFPEWVYEHPAIDDDLRARILHQNAADVFPGIEVA